jgi:hypothetical protein
VQHSHLQLEVVPIEDLSHQTRHVLLTGCPVHLPRCERVATHLVACRNGTCGCNKVRVSVHILHLEARNRM